MTRRHTTALLWLANLLGWSGLCIIALTQFGMLAGRPADALPEVRAVRPQPLPAAQAAAEVGARNPFDPGAGRWLAAAPKAELAGAAGAGELRGIVLLPGVRAAVTGAGAVHVGENFAGGRMVGIKGGKVLVQREGIVTEVDVAAMRSPSLQSLNGAVPLLGKPPASAKAAR